MAGPSVTINLKSLVEVLGAEDYARVLCDDVSLEMEGDKFRLSFSVETVGSAENDLMSDLEEYLRAEQVRAFANLYGIPEGQLKKFLAARAFK